MEGGNHVISRPLVRSVSMRDCVQLSPKKKSRIARLISLKHQKSNGHARRVSVSLDDMLNEDVDNDDSFEEFHPLSNSYRWTEDVRALTEEETHGSNDFIGRVRSFSCNDSTAQFNSVNQKENSYLNNFRNKNSCFGRSSSLKHLKELESDTMQGRCRQTEDNLKGSGLSRSIYSSGERDENNPKRSVQLRRCISLYERRRTPHHCCERQSEEVSVRPWTFGDEAKLNGCKNTQKRSAAVSNGIVKYEKHVRKMSNSLDSSEGNSQRSSRLSTTSGSSVDFDFDSSPSIEKLPSKHADTDGNRKQHSRIPRGVSSAWEGKKQGAPNTDTFRNNVGQSKGVSFIPRPIVSPGIVSKSRPQSLTVNVTTVRTTTEKMAYENQLSPMKWTGVEKCVSMTEKKISYVSKSAPTTPSLTSAVVRESDSSNMSLNSSSSSTSSASKRSVMNTVTSRRTNRTFVDEDEDGYPEPHPSTQTKSEIFNSRDFTSVDQHALKAPDELTCNFDDLLNYLLEDIVGELSKLRAIYRWIVAQHLPLTVKQGEINQDSPLGFLYNIRQKRATYSELFAVLCRRAGIPCVIIYGVAKSVAYDVGDKVNHKKMKNTWNAVYIQNEWRLVHPYWASQSAKGYHSGRWAVVECDSFHDDDGDSRQLVAHTVNEFFFLTDPDKFITKCFPDDPSWQLLKIPLTKPEFEYLPFLQPAFYELKLKLKTHNHSCVIHAEEGNVKLTIHLPAERGKRYRFRYKLFIHRDWEAEGEYDEIVLDRYLLHYIDDQDAHFDIRFPVSGMYKLELHCNYPKRQLPSDWICDFKIICSEPMPNCEPLPVVPSIGWGPGLELESYGIECLTHSQGLVNLDTEPTTFLRFALPKDKDISIEAELLKNNESRTEMNSHVVLEQDGELTVVQVSPPTEGEYALQLYVKQEGTDGRLNVCNYLMHRTHVVEDPDLADIRKELTDAIELADVDALSHWIERFTEKGMDDRGDLAAAKKKLHLARLNRDLREAISRKDLDLLERSMQSASGTSIRRQLGKLALEAEAMRSRLRRLKRLRHAVLEMDQKTISEIRSYPKPPPAVHAVMAATFLLLGNKEGEVKKWSKIQGLISKRGKQSLKRRVADFKVDSVSPAVLARVCNILNRYDIEAVQIASTGAATFYQWALTTSGEVEADMEKE